MSPFSQGTIVGIDHRLIAAQDNPSQRSIPWNCVEVIHGFSFFLVLISNSSCMCCIKVEWHESQESLSFSRLNIWQLDIL